MQLALWLAVVLSFSSPRAIFAFDWQTCEPCHGASISADDSRTYLHSPFALRQCTACHAAPAASGADAVAKKAAAKKARKKITWLADSVVVGQSHGFVLPANKLGEILVVDRKGMDGQKTRSEIPVPSLHETSTVEDSGQAPVISNLRVLQVQRGVFLSVTIGWRTDTLTTATIDYGEKELNQTSDPVKRFGRQHRVVLYNLKPDTDYHFVVHCTDLFGRSQSSEKLTFSTAKPLHVDEPDSVAAPEPTGAADLSSSFRRFKGDYLVELSSTDPFLAFVGSMGDVQRRGSAGNDASVSPGKIEPHKGFSSESYVTMDGCKTCHRSQTSVTHPVNVFPKPGMTIPPEYPTLPDGRITCASCHFTHSSDYEFLTVKPGRRELCVGCHKDML